MCSVWRKPEQGVFISITCECGKYCIVKRGNSYEPLIRSGNTWRALGFDSAEKAKEHIFETKKM